MWFILITIIVLERTRSMWPIIVLPTWIDMRQAFSFHMENFLSSGPPHPHKGAMDATGQLGYIHDPFYVKKTHAPFDPATVCSVPYGEGEEGANGIHALRKIKIATAPAAASSGNNKVLCIVYTHSNRHEVLRSIVETYAPRCDGFLAASNETDQTLGAVNLLHAGPEAYDNMWQKVRSIWSYVHDHYRDDFDWYHIGGDNMIVFAENLKQACSEAAAQSDDDDKKPVYMGGAMHRPPYLRKIYCGGGSGYTLNRAALDLLVEKKLATCVPHHVSSDEDRIVAHCLSPEVKCHHSVDDLDESRYHPLSPDYHAAWKVRARAPWRPQILKEHHGITAAMKEGLEGISKTSVSFHLLDAGNSNTTSSLSKDGGLKRMHAIVNGLCDQK